MNERLILDTGNPPFPDLCLENGLLIIRRTGRALSESIFLVFPLVGVGIVVTGGLVAFVGMLWIGVTHFDGVAFIASIVFGLALVPALWCLFVLQGLLFPFKVILGAEQYLLRNGMAIVTRKIHPQESEVVVYPIYRRGDWGYGTRIRFKNGRLSWPFIPGGIIGTKHNALQEAQKIRDWLQKNSIVGKVTLEKWGDTQKIEPGVDYIR